MKSADQMRAGSDPRSVRELISDKRACGARLAIAITMLFLGAAAHGQALYKYQDENGAWIYTDRPPGDEQAAEIRELPTGAKAPVVTVSTRHVDREFQFVARNDYHAPVEVVLALDELTNVQYPGADQVMRWLVDPRSTLQ